MLNMSVRTNRVDNKKSEALHNTNAAVGAGDSCKSLPLPLHQGPPWLDGQLGNNNNNSLEAAQNGKETIAAHEIIVTKWNCQSCDASIVGAGTASTTSANTLVINDRLSEMADSVEDKGGGFPEQINGAQAISPTIEEGAVAITVTNYACYVPGAVSLTPPDKSHSNRTSMNNSTENLSCSSDNFYGHDDIILLDDVDVDVEEVSLNSDDCVYAYRGDGADFNAGLININRADDNATFGDDETDFLEMDFEPDPLSEVECGSAEASMAHRHLNDYIMQCNISNHVSGRHSANIGIRDSAAERQLLSSPIDDLPPPKALQSQSLLSKNLARISLHLDQIKGSEPNDCDRSKQGLCDERKSYRGDGLSTSSSLAQSLPNTLNSTLFVNNKIEKQNEDKSTSPSKITGAKPKRFSTSSSSSSKHSTKSRQSILSVSLLPSFGDVGTTFDERSVSCAEFRSVPPDVNFSGIFGDTISTAPNEDYNSCDENCLDCLEKEFITNTVGQSPGIDCPKCRKHSSTTSLHSHVKDYASGRKDVSSSHFGVETVFESPTRYAGLGHKDGFPTTVRSRPNDNLNLKIELNNKDDAITDANQRTMCDNYDSIKLLKNFNLTEPEVVKICTGNLTEETLVQALEKLNVSYSIELIQAYFNYTNTQSPQFKATGGCFKNLKQFLLHESKKYCNYMKIKRLIELATGHSVRVKFKKDPDTTNIDMVPVDVNDILQQWSVKRDLNVLKTLDKRFQDANVLGKIAHIIRLSEQHESTHSSMPDFITIPQYYPSGHLTLTKIC